MRALGGHGGRIRERLECGRVEMVSERGLGPSDEAEQHHVVWVQEQCEEWRWRPGMAELRETQLWRSLCKLINS